MAEEAIIRIKLDTGSAKQELEALYGMMGNAPGVNVPGGGKAPPPATPPGGADMGPAGSAAGGGSSWMKWLAGAVAAQQLGGVSVGAGAAMTRDELRQQLLGPALGSARGALASREAVASQYGRAYQLGLIDDEGLRQRFQFENEYGAGLDAKGAARARNALSDDAVSAAGSDLVEAAAAAIPFFEEVKDSIRAIVQKMGG